MGVLLLALMMLEGARACLHLDRAFLPSLCLMVAIVPYLMVQAGKVGRLFIMLSILMAGIAAMRLENSAEVLGEALSRAAFFQAFLTAVFTLQEAAYRSATINQIGLYLISQPLRKQSILTLLGTNAMALMMNMGSLVMIGALARDRAAGNQPSGSGASQRSEMTAVAAIRGFSPSAMWSPLALPPVFLSSLMSGVTPGEAMRVGFVLSMAVLIFSCLFTYLQGSIVLHRHAVPTVDARRLPLASMMRLALLLCGIFLAIYLATEELALSSSAAVMIIIPLTSCLWMVVGQGHSLTSLVTGPLRSMATIRLPRQAAETSVIVSAAFLGPVIVELFSIRVVAQAVQDANFSAFTLLSLAYLAVLALAMVGINPVLTTTLAVAVIADPAAHGVSPLALIAILSAAWAMAAQFSPYTGTATIIGRLFDIPAERLVLVRNGPFMAVTILLSLAGIYAFVALK